MTTGRRQEVSAPGTSSVPLALLLGALFGLGGLGSTAMAVVLPQAADALGVSVAQGTWLISLYALTLAVSTPVYGRLVDLFGVRVPLLVGVVLMSVGALMAASATTFGVMVLARLLQGLGTGVGMTLSVAVISTRFVGLDRARGLAVAAGTAAAVGAFGPVVGGLTESVATWRGTTALPAFALVLLVLLWRRVEGGGVGTRFDVPGALLVSVAAGGLIVLLQSPSAGLPVAVFGGAMALVAAPLVVWRSSRVPHGFLPAAVLMNARLVRTCLVAGAIPAAWFALLVAVPARLAHQGWSPAQVGLAMVPGALVAILVPGFAPRVTARSGPVRILAVSAGLVSVALLTSGLGAWAGPSPQSAVAMVTGVALVSAAFALGQPCLFMIVGGITASDVRGVASGFATLVFLVCGSAGSAVVGGLSGLVGFHGGLLVLAALCACCGVLALVEALHLPATSHLTKQSVD